MMKEYDYIFKVILIGDKEVGKTCLLLRFVDDSFSTKECTVQGFRSRTLSVDGKDVRVQLYDNLEEKSTFYAGALGIMLVYDVTEEDTFTNLKQWLEEINRHASRNVNTVLVGNKSDLIRQKFVEYDTAKEFADKFKLSFFEVSAKDGTNVEEAFMTLLTEIKTRIELEGPEAMDLAAKGAHIDPPTEGGGRCTIS